MEQCWHEVTWPRFPCIVVNCFVLRFAGGDIFIHAKSNNISKLYELTQLVVSSFPTGAIDKAEDVYGWVYQNGRDLSGFIDGKIRKGGTYLGKHDICMQLAYYDSLMLSTQFNINEG